MDLKTLLPGLKQATSDYYWSLIVEPGWIQAGIWKIEDGKADVVSVSPVTPWQSDGEIIGAADTALSSAVQNFPEDSKEPTKTIFGVPAFWVEGGQIKPEYLDKIKKVCTELSLEPSGFVVLPEAIANYYKSQEGAPLNAVVLNVGQDSLEVSVFRLGNLVGTYLIARSVSVADDVIEGLVRFSTTEPLPSRIIIYDGKEGELENTRQALLDTNWGEVDKVKFLHTPKVEILTTDQKVMAVSLAGAAEISGVSKVESEVSRLPAGEVPEEIENIQETPPREISPEELGFAMGEDVAGNFSQPLPSPPPPKKIKLTFKFPHLKITKKPILLGGFIFLVLVMLGISSYIFLPKATITVYVNPQKVSQQSNLTVDLKGNKDAGSGTLAGQLVNVSVEGNRTKATSGTKLVGTKAKGTINVQNGTDTNLNLPAQTLITSAANLKFTINSTASVSAALSPTSPGTTQVEVTASDIGADYNLAKGEVFKISNYPKSEVDAVSTSEFSGGTSQQISAVSSADLKSLETDLKSELMDNAQKSLNLTTTQGNLLIPESLVATVTSETFSAKVGDEAVNVSLKLKLDVEGAVVTKADLIKTAQNLLSGKLPSGYRFDTNQLTSSFTLNGVKDGQYTFGVIFSTVLLPQIKADEIVKNIKGLPVSSALAYLESVPGFVRADVTRKFHFPIAFLDRLPLITKNINLEVAADR